jgi:hypothetical protein
VDKKIKRGGGGGVFGVEKSWKKGEKRREEGGKESR